MQSSSRTQRIQSGHSRLRAIRDRYAPDVRTNLDRVQSTNYFRSLVSEIFGDDLTRGELAEVYRTQGLPLPTTSTHSK